MIGLAKLLQLSGWLLLFWHSYRAEFLLSAGILIIIGSLAVYWPRRKEGAWRNQHLTPAGDESKSVCSVPQPSQVQQPRETRGLRSKASPRRITGRNPAKASPADYDVIERPIAHIQPYIFYFSLGGSTKLWSEKFAEALTTWCLDDRAEVLPPLLHDLTRINYDDYFLALPQPTRLQTASFYCLLIPSYNIDTELSNFLEHLQETHHDFRIDTAPLAGLAGYSVFAFGDKREWPTEKDGFCSQAADVDKWMARLTGRKRAFPLGMADVGRDVACDLWEWIHGVEESMRELARGHGLGAGVPGSGDAVESEDEADEDEADEETVFSRASKSYSRRVKAPLGADLEDLRMLSPEESQSRTNAPPAAKAMVPEDSPIYAALTKQGYTIVGSHSGVKICRWTKSALRGRGSCYKYSFYGIQSHLCMEATPSLSCSNKCIFCWRHGTNPVGTSWRWTVDPPQTIFDGMREGHYKKIKMMKGVPGVRAERFAAAMRIRHCALSLVGEPIFYPHINELLSLLHKEHISSFLVCNAQHPDQLASLGPVTQLYVSIDASNKDSLRRIDRPLHRDFWERFLRCMDILRERRFVHRTVFRLTLVKGFNIEEEVEGYAGLVARALPGFVEVKGVTYCGTSTAAGAGLSMRNVPFYEEVAEFVLKLEAALQRRGLDYGIAAEHAHSCCILLADRTRFFRRCPGEAERRWLTHIDFAKFFECLESGQNFGPEDYLGDPTPEWALWGNGGFDPRDERVDRKGRPKE